MKIPWDAWLVLFLAIAATADIAWQWALIEHGDVRTPPGAAP